MEAEIKLQFPKASNKGQDSSVINKGGGTGGPPPLDAMGISKGLFCFHITAVFTLTSPAPFLHGDDAGRAEIFGAVGTLVHQDAVVGCVLG